MINDYQVLHRDLSKKILVMPLKSGRECGWVGFSVQLIAWLIIASFSLGLGPAGIHDLSICQFPTAANPINPIYNALLNHKNFPHKRREADHIAYTPRLPIKETVNKK